MAGFPKRWAIVAGCAHIRFMKIWGLENPLIFDYSRVKPLGKVLID